MTDACLARHARAMRSYMRLRPQILPASCSTTFGWTGIYLTQLSRLSSLMRRFPCRSEAKCGFRNEASILFSLGFLVLPNSWKSSDSDWDVHLVIEMFVLSELHSLGAACYGVAYITTQKNKKETSPVVGEDKLLPETTPLHRLFAFPGFPRANSFWSISECEMGWE